MKLEDRVLKANLMATERRLWRKNQPSSAFYVRQALDKLYPGWREPNTSSWEEDRYYGTSGQTVIM